MHNNSGTSNTNAAQREGTASYSYPTLVKGINYTNPKKPQDNTLTVPAQGISDKDKKNRLATLQRLQNAWEVEGKKAEVEKTMHNAHGKHFQAMGAAVQAGTSLVQAGTAWNKYQVAVADNRISRAEKNAAIASISTEVERINIEVLKKKEALEKSEMELKQMILDNSNKRQDFQENQQLASLQGYVVVPQLNTFISNITEVLKPGEDIVYEAV